ncbi:MAG: hypothetical protein R6X35_05755 [Candidatus Krumholzibacteriia bacterium]
MHCALRLGLVYLLGPAGLLLCNSRRRGRAWSLGAGLWALAAAALVLGWWALASGRGGGAFVPWLAAGTVATVGVAFTLWARAVHLVATDERLAGHDWSPRLTTPWAAALLALAAPGSAFVLARRPGRAVATLWSAWPFTAAVLVVLQLPLVWAHRAAFAPWGLPPAALEHTLLAAAVLAAVAPLLWLGQALEGARVLAARSGRWRDVRGDWSAVALAAAVTLAVLVADPGTIAAGLGEYADQLGADGCTVTPLVLVRAARQLDPAQPAYALREADLLAASGAADRASQVRAELDRTLQPYLGALFKDGQRERASARQEASGRATAAAVGPPAPGGPASSWP